MEIPVKKVQIMNTNTNATSTGIFHKFRALSELKDEAKGGYIPIHFEVPDGVQTIELELATKGGTPHPHPLFITPYSKSRNEKGKKNDKTSNRNFDAYNYKVDLGMDEFGKFKVDKPDYVTDKTIDLVGPNFWNKETRTINLGFDGLRLTVVKSGQRQKIQHLDEVKKIRNIKDDYEEGKVVLQVRFDGSHWIPLKVLVDQTKYLIQTQLCTTSRICNFGDHVIFVVFEKASITADKEKFLEMILFQEENEDMIYMEKARSSDVHKIGDLFAFKVNLNTICVDSQAYMLVKIIDEDVPDSKIEPIPIRVIKHEDGNVDCPCQDSIKHLSLFKNIQKRTNSESSSCSAKKLCQNSPMANSLSPPSDFSPTSNLDGNISPNNIAQNGGDIELVDEKVIVENLPSAEVQNLPDLGDIGFENFLSADGPISLKNRNLYQKCFLCKAKPIFSDYATKLSFTFDSKFVLSVVLSVFILYLMVKYC